MLFRSDAVRRGWVEGEDELPGPRWFSEPPRAAFPEGRAPPAAPEPPPAVPPHRRAGARTRRCAPRSAGALSHPGQGCKQVKSKKKDPDPARRDRDPFFRWRDSVRFLDPLTCERSNSASLTLHRAVGGSGAPQLWGSDEDQRSLRRPVRFQDPAGCQRDSVLSVNSHPCSVGGWPTPSDSTGRIRNARPLFTLSRSASRFLASSPAKTRCYSVTLFEKRGYASLNGTGFELGHRIVNRLI